MKRFPSPVPKRAVVLTLGCKLNQAESEAIARDLSAAGWQLTDRAAPADAFVVNTCAVTHVASRKSRHYVRLARRLSPGAKVIVTGCAVEAEGAQVMREAGADLVLAGREKDKVAVLLTEDGVVPAGRERPCLPCPLRTRSFVKVQEGCSQVCSFCIVPRTRGPERSVPRGEVLQQVRARVEGGTAEVVLTGTQLGAYGKDTDDSLDALIAAVLRETPVRRVRVSSLQPPDFSPALLRLWDDPRLCRHFHIPLQSGSDAVLQRMRRRYISDGFRRAVRDIRAALPDAAVTTDVIVGFPGETDADFEATCRLCEEAELSGIHVFPFSRRPGTLAAGMPDPVPEPVKRERVARLLTLAEQLHARFLERLAGTTSLVLWEKQAGGLWEGLTGNYARVLARGDGRLENTLTRTRLLHREDGALRGELID